MLRRCCCQGGSWRQLLPWGVWVQSLQRRLAPLGRPQDPTPGCCGSRGARHWGHGVVNCAFGCFSSAAQRATKDLLAQECRADNRFETNRCACDCAAVATPRWLWPDLQQGQPLDASGGLFRSEGARLPWADLFWIHRPCPKPPIGFFPWAPRCWPCMVAASLVNPSDCISPC